MSEEKTVKREQTTTVDDEGGSDETNEELGDRLHRLKEHSVDNNAVEGEVIDVEESDSSVEFTVELLTTGEVVTETMPIPEPWHEQSKLAHVLDDRGYGPAAIDMMVGERVTMRKWMDGRWRMTDPRGGKMTKFIRRIGIVTAVGVALFIGGLGVILSVLIDSLIPVIISLFVLVPTIAAIYLSWRLVKGVADLFRP